MASTSSNQSLEPLPCVAISQNHGGESRTSRSPRRRGERAGVVPLTPLSECMPCCRVTVAAKTDREQVPTDQESGSRYHLHREPISPTARCVAVRSRSTAGPSFQAGSSVHQSNNSSLAVDSSERP